MNSCEIVIKNNRFVCRLYNMDSFLEMPLKNIRKLWKLMFDEAWNNEESITNLKQWLLNTDTRLALEAEVNEWELVRAIRYAEEARRVKEAHGPAATVEIRKAAMDARKEAKSTERLYKQSRRNCVRIGKLAAVFQERYDKVYPGGW